MQCTAAASTRCIPVACLDAVVYRAAATPGGFANVFAQGSRAFCGGTGVPGGASTPSLNSMGSFLGAFRAAGATARVTCASTVAPVAPRAARQLIRRAASGGPAGQAKRQTPVAAKRAAQAAAAVAASPARARGATVTPPPSVVDGMPRFPEASVPGALRAADYFGTAVFAMTGTLAAATRGMDLLGSVVVGTITAVGGGTVRDLLLGAGRRAFWMEEIEYLWICVVTSGATFLAWPRLQRWLGVTENDAWVDWGDAIGVGAFCVIGAQNGIRAGVPCAAAVACGMFTATFGGVIRDVLVERPVRILHSYADVYATAALTGATTYMLARAAGAPLSARIVLGAGAAVAVRVAAWTYDLKLPTYASQEARAKAAEKGDAGEGMRLPLQRVVDAAFDALGVGGGGDEEGVEAKGEAAENAKKRNGGRGLFGLGGAK